MKKLFLSAGILPVLLLAGDAMALSLELENQTKWEIHELYFSDVDEEEWGPDQLGDEVIETGETYKLSKIPKGKYDVKIVDEDGDSCEIEDVDFNSSEHFKMTDKVLLGCQAATEEETEEDED